MSYNLQIKETRIKFLIFSILIYLISVVVTPSASPDAAETLPPYLKITTNESDPQVLKAGDSIDVTFLIENDGPGDAIGVILKLSSEDDLQGLSLSSEDDLLGSSLPAFINVADIPKGGDDKVTIKISGSYELPDVKGKIEVSCSVPAFPNKTFPGDPISLETRKLVRVKLILEDFKALPVGGGSTSSNNHIYIQQTIDLKFRITNKSKVPVENVEVKVENTQPGVRFLQLADKTESKTKRLISKLDPGPGKEFTFRCHTNDDFKEDKLQLKIYALFTDKAGRKDGLNDRKGEIKNVTINKSPPGRWPFIVAICTITILIIGIFFWKYLKKDTQWVVIGNKELSYQLHRELRLGPVATMRKLLGKASIPEDLLKELNQLDIRYVVRDLAGLEKAVNLKILVCNYRRISDIRPLAELKQLEQLSLHGNEISDITPLAELKQLEQLSLSGNKISDITPLAELKQLKKLYLDGNEISDITALAELKGVRELSLKDNSINDVSVLEKFEHLESLDISGNRIDSTAIDKLCAKLPKLKVKLPLPPRRSRR